MITLRIPNSQPQYSEPAFRILEKDLIHITTTWAQGPNVIVLRPRLWKPSSYTTKFRQVCAAVLHPACDWSSPLDRGILFSMFQTGITLTPDNVANTVTISPRSAIQFHPSKAEAFSLLEGEIDVSLDFKILDCICYLKNLNLLPQPVRVYGVTEPSAETLMSAYPNITFAEDSPLRYQIY